MNFLFVFFITLFGSALTFFSGFGLGTILLPVFLVFFSPELAIVATAIVHFSNSVFKFGYVYKHIHFPVLFRFGIPAVIAAFLGAELLSYVGQMENLFSYEMGGRTFKVSGIQFLIGLLIVLFTWIESSKRIGKIKFEKNYLVVGGILSGFFGGVSGHQGALRSLFLKQMDLSKEQFVGTSNAISLGIDIVRIFTYIQLVSLSVLFAGEQKYFIIIAILGAFIGASLGYRILKKVTISVLHTIISILLILFGLLMAAGII